MKINITLLLLSAVYSIYYTKITKISPFPNGSERNHATSTYFPANIIVKLEQRCFVHVVSFVFSSYNKLAN